MSDLFEVITEAEYKREGVVVATPRHATPSQSFVDEDVQMKLCQWCGWCEDPDHCVWGVQCPQCCAPPMQQCTASDGRITGLHQERHGYAKTLQRA